MYHEPNNRRHTEVTSNGSAPPGGVGSGTSPFQVEGMHLREMLSVLRRRVWMVLAVTLLVVGPATAWLWQQQPRYSATAVILIADARQRLTSGIEAEVAERVVGRSSDAILSQIEVLRGRTVLGNVVDREGLRLTSPDFPLSSISRAYVSPDAAIDSLNIEFRPDEFVVRGGGQEGRAPYGTEVDLGGIGFAIDSPPESERGTLLVRSRDAAINSVASGLQASVRERTDVIQITFTAAEPARARRIANAVAEEFQAYNAETAQQQSRRRRLFIEEQLRTTDSLQAELQLALSTYRQNKQLFSSRDLLAAQQQALMSLDIRRAEMDSDRAMYESLLTGLLQGDPRARGARVRTLISSPGIASNPVISQLYSQLSEYESAREALTSGPSGSTRANPDVERLDALITGTHDRLVDAVRSHVASLEARVSALQDLRVRNVADIRQLPDIEAEEARLAQQVSSISRVAEELRMELQKARIAEAVEAGRVEIIHLAPGAERVPLGRAPKLALALLVGLMLGSGGAFAAEAMNTSIRRQQELDSVLHIPNLAIIPRILPDARIARQRRLPPVTGGGGGHDRNVLDKGAEFGLVNTRSPDAEAYRKLRNNIMFSRMDEPLKTLTITSAVSGEGKTLTAANLAVAFAGQGKRVLLIDCDLYRGRLHRLFGIPREPGLVDLVAGEATLTDSIRITSVAGLFVLPTGTFHAADAAFFDWESAERTIELLAAEFDHLILDAPPVLATADAAAVATLGDGTLLVLRAGRTDRVLAQQAIAELRHAGARVVGSVLNDPEEKLLDRPHAYEYAYHAVNL
jgi:capsular exopolysaccharide synthesis family protein